MTREVWNFTPKIRNGEEYENEDISGEYTMLSNPESQAELVLPFMNIEVMDKGVKIQFGNGVLYELSINIFKWFGGNYEKFEIAI